MNIVNSKKLLPWALFISWTIMCLAYGTVHLQQSRRVSIDEPASTVQYSSVVNGREIQQKSIRHFTPGLISWTFGSLCIFLLPLLQNKKNNKSDNPDPFQSELPALIFSKNVHLEYIFVNQRFCEFVGRKPDEIIGKKAGDLFDEKSAATSEQNDTSSFEISSKNEGVLEKVYRDGSGPVSLIVSRIPTRDNSGQINGISCLAIPFTSLNDNIETGRSLTLEDQEDAVQKAAVHMMRDAQKARLKAEKMQAKSQASENELREALEELQRFHRLTMGRENRIIELKIEVNGLCKELGRPTEYKNV